MVAIRTSSSRTHTKKMSKAAPGAQKASSKPASKRQATTLPFGQERLEKAMAHMGFASRREAKDLITRGQVTVNGVVVRIPGHGIVSGKDTIVVAGSALDSKESVLVYKPRGVETTKTTPKVRDLHDQFPALRNLAPIGRLDKDSEGLIIMTNDGTLTRALTGEDGTVGKEYLVEVREFVTDHMIARMTSGIKLDGVMTKPARVKRLGRLQFSIVLYEGRKHQIRRMCDACHLTIESLIRVGIGHLTIKTLGKNKLMNLTARDVAQLKA